MCAEVYRSMTSGCRGTHTVFQGYDRELAAFETCDFGKEKGVGGATVERLGITAMQPDILTLDARTAQTSRGGGDITDHVPSRGSPREGLYASPRKT